MDSHTDPAPRRYSRRKLRGRVHVTWSARITYPKLHVDATCEALDHTPEEARGQCRMELLELAACEWGRPCRMCGLESVLNTVLDPRRVTGDEPVTFATFTSQSNPLSPDQSGGPYGYQWHASTESGQRRLERVAKQAGLAVTLASCGPVAYGFVSADAAKALTHNLRCVLRPDVTELPHPEVISCVWALLGDNPPEIDPGNVSDVWQIATKLITGL